MGEEVNSAEQYIALKQKLVQKYFSTLLSKDYLTEDTLKYFDEQAFHLAEVAAIATADSQRVSLYLTSSDPMIRKLAQLRKQELGSLNDQGQTS